MEFITDTLEDRITVTEGGKLTALPATKIHYSGQEALSVARITFPDEYGFLGTNFSINVYNAELSSVGDRRMTMTMRSDKRGADDRLFTLFYAELYDVWFKGVYGPSYEFIGSATDPFRFYPDGYEPSEGEQEKWPLDVWATNLPRRGKAMRVNIRVTHKSKDWIVNGL